jgi:hypothetical protein
MAKVDEAPDGLVFRAKLLSEDDERAILAEIERLEFQEIRMHGVVARRTARHFGFDYDYERRGLIHDAERIPEWLLPVRDAAGGLAGVTPEELVEALVQRYPKGRRSAGTATRRCSAPSSGSRSGRRGGCGSDATPAASGRPSSSSWRRAPAMSSRAPYARRGSTMSRRPRACATRSRSGRSAIERAESLSRGARRRRSQVGPVSGIASTARAAPRSVRSAAGGRAPNSRRPRSRSS